MIAVSPVVPGRELLEIKLAEHQPQYQTLPIVELRDGFVLSRFELSDAEKVFVRDHGSIDLFTWTFGHDLQASIIVAKHPDFSESDLPSIEQKLDGGTVEVTQLADGVVLSRFELSEDQKSFVAEHGYIYLFTSTDGAAFQPIALRAEEVDRDA